MYWKSAKSHWIVETRMQTLILLSMKKKLHQPTVVLLLMFY